MKKIMICTTLLFLLAFVGKSQIEITFSPSNDALLTSDKYIPFVSTAAHLDQHTQCIYPASIIPRELIGAEFTKLSFHVTSSLVGWGEPIVTIRLMNTQATDLINSFLDVSSSTLVYQEGDFKITTEWELDKIILTLDPSTPFIYTGDNLLLDFSFMGGNNNYVSLSCFGQRSPVPGSSRKFIQNRPPNGSEMVYDNDFLPRLIIECIPPLVKEVETLPYSNMTQNSVKIHGKAFNITDGMGFKYNVNGGNWKYVSAETEEKTDYTAMSYVITEGLGIDSIVNYYAWGVKEVNDTAWGEIATVIITADCIAPILTEITNISQTGATVKWKVTSEAPDFNIRYKAKDDPEWHYKNSAPDGILTGLDAGTTYQVQVQAACLPTKKSVWSQTMDFRTSCGIISVPYLENFDFNYTLSKLCYKTDIIRVGNTVESYHASMEVDTIEEKIKINQQLMGAPFEYFLMLPKFDVNVNLLRIRFNAYSELFWENAGMGIVKIGVTQMDNWRTFKPILEEEFTLSQKLYSFSLSSYNEDITETDRVTIKITANYGTIIRLDDIEVMVDNDCSFPYNVTVSDIQSKQVRIDWEAESDQTSWSVQYRSKLEEDEWSVWQSEITGTHPYILTGLQAGTDYQVRIRAICGEIMSDASRVIPFTTLAGSGISKSTHSSIQVYSNQSNVYIVNHEYLTINSVEIIDLYGRLIYRGLVNHNPEVINMSVPTGNYIVRVMTRDNVMNYKVFIVN